MAIYGDRNWHSDLLGVLSIIGVLAHVIFCCENHALAQITPDGTLGNNSSRITPNVNIKGLPADRIDGGAIRGANLFHSFQEFNVGELQRVYFTNPTGIKNILTRVTGSNISNILGTLGVDGDANLFFLNPNGILFGRNARLDVAGSFVASTANSFVFGKGLEFSATNPQTPSSLLTVNPSALFFNQLQAGRIENRSIAPAGIDPAGFNAFGLRVGDGKSLLLVGGNVSMDGGKLNAYGGRVELGGLSAPGNVNLLFNGDNLSLKFPENTTRADISLTNQAGVFVTGAGSGNIAVNARNLEILAGSLLSAGIGVGLGTPESVAGDITLKATGEIKIADSGSRIRNLVRLGSKGNGGNIIIDSGSLSLQNDAQLAASTFGQGNGGNVIVRVKDTVSLTDNSNIFSTVEVGGVGRGGNIDINAASVSLIDGAQLVASTFGQGNGGNVIVRAKDTVSLTGEQTSIFSTVEVGGVGRGGNIDINAASVSLIDGAQLLASTSGVGNGGNVTVDAKNAVSLAGQPTAILSKVEAGGVGQGGNIDINAVSLSLADGAQLQTSTRGTHDNQPAAKGDAGNVNIKVTGQVEITGQKNNNGLFSTIDSSVDTGTVGNGGNITIDSGDFSLQDGAQLSASTYGQGNAGNVTVTAKNAVDLAGEETNIYSTVEAGGVGRGGNIDINAASLSLIDGAQLQTITRGASDNQPAGKGDAGNVKVKVTGVVDIAGVKNGLSSAILSFVDINTVGNGGNITIDSGSLKLRNGARLSALTSAQGNAGNVTVTTKDAVFLAGNAAIFTEVETGGVGKGGNIDINAATLSLIDGAQLITLTSPASDNQPAGKGDAGNVKVKVTGVVDIAGVKNGFSSAILSRVGPGTEGNGGNIIIDADSLKLRDGALLDASTYNNSKGGDITVNANVFEATGGGQLTTTTSSNGRAGKVTVNATDRVILSGSDPNYNDRVTKFPSRVGNIGANSGFFVSSSGSGITGDIEINSPKITLDNQGKLNAESASGNGGNINVNSDLLLLRRNSEISTNAGTAEKGGNGGNININSRFIVAVPNENSDISANAFSGKGGRVDIESDGLFGIVPQKSPTEKSDITASSQLGVSGEVIINTPDVDPSRGLIQLPSNLVDVSQQITQGCTPRRGQNANRFIATGRGGLPQSPNEPLRGRAVITGWVDLPPQATPRVTDKLSTATVTKSTDQIVEAQGWIVDANGDIMLVAQSGQSSSIPPAMSCSQ
ncbi:MAG: filamentous hemagglutinin N-terminal domain-containing protein [Nostoc sp.]|uniref:two-partner secretion domain-containing protein n=1 Tax=Nostoc sp. TaxID=1180 RepID=UPI002FF5A257